MAQELCSGGSLEIAMRPDKPVAIVTKHGSEVSQPKHNLFIKYLSVLCHLILQTAVVLLARALDPTQYND